MDSSVKSVEKRTLKEIPIQNPFLREFHVWNRENELYDKIKTVIFTILLVPIRVVAIILLLLIAWALAHVGLAGLSKEELRKKPLTGWRWKVRSVVALLFRAMFAAGSANWVTVKGKRVSSKEAPILVGAPHSSFFDALVVLVSGPGTVVGKVEAAEIPFYGRLIDMAQPIYVKRENHESRTQTIHDIIERCRSADMWPQIFIFPEGTCTNGEVMIDFKPGAFVAGVPVQPVLIRYPNKIDTYTWTWLGPNVFVLLWRTLAQLNSNVEIEYLPVYSPNDEEIKNPKIFAKNVQALMAKALNLPISEYSFEDCKLMDYAYNCKLAFATSIADIARLREKIGLASSQIEEYIVKENFKGFEDHYIKFEEFLHHLKIPADDVSYTLFKLFADPIAKDVVDFKEYLLHSIFLIKIKEPKIESVKLLFMLFGENGKLHRESLNRILNHFSRLSPSKINQLFYSIDKDKRGYITFDEFKANTENDSTYAKLYRLNPNFRHKTASR